MDTLIESCLILMVLLLLTCARHLLVECTALTSPMYLLTVSCRGHQVVLCLPNCSPAPSPSTVTFSELSSKCHQSVTSPVILPCVCKSWLFVLKQPGGSLSSFSPPGKKKRKTQHGVQFGMGEFPLITSLWVLPVFLLPHYAYPLLTSCIHPFIHPFNIHPPVDDSDDQDWNHQSGLLEEVYEVFLAVFFSATGAPGGDAGKDQTSAF